MKNEEWKKLPYPQYGSFLSKEVNVCEKYFVILQIDNMRRREDEQCEQII